MRQIAIVATLLLAAVRTFGSSLVTTEADSGPGSLRQALLDANAGICVSPCAITFASNVRVIAPQSPLPIITASNVSVEGNFAPA